MPRSLIFITFTILFAFSNTNTVIAQTNSCTISNHDDGSASGKIDVRFYVLPDVYDPDIGTYAIYRGVPDLVNFSNRLEIWQNPHADLIIDSFRGLSADTYYVTFHDGINLHVFVRTILREGCTDPNANNYDPLAVINNGSCTYNTQTCPDITSVVSTEPSCGNSNGVIQIFSTGTSLQYSINGGGTYQSSDRFSSLGADTYNIKVRNSQLGCTDATTYTLNCNDDGACPTIDYIHIGNPPATCSSMDAWIDIVTPGTNNEYSIDGGGSWQSTSSFGGLSAGTYAIRTRNAETGCGDSRSFTLPCTPSCSDGKRNGSETGTDCGGPCAPCCPEDIRVTVLKHPYCPSGNEGQFAVYASGVDLEYSRNNGNSYQNSNVFNNVPAYNINIAVRSKKTGCVRKLFFPFQCVATCPSIESVEITEPNCDLVQSGQLTIVLSEGQGNLFPVKSGEIGASGSFVYEFSIDGGNTWQPGNSFPVDGGDYTVVVRNNETGCVTGQSVSITSCNSCYDGIQNGYETDEDCGGSQCHTCNCPTVNQIKQSASQIDQGSLGGLSGSGETKSTFICDLPENYDCPNCISYRSCHDDLDNDGDELCDCEDTDCSTWYSSLCTKPVEQCSDGLDNDFDGLVDCTDPQCDNSFVCQDAGANRSTDSDIELRKEILLNEYEHISNFIAVEGIPIWDKSLRLGPIGSAYPKAVPVLRPQGIKLSGVLFVDNRETIRYRYYSREEIDLMAGKPEKESSSGNSSETSHSLEDKVRIVGMFHQLQANLGGTLDPYHNTFLDQSKNQISASLQKMPGCEPYTKCVTLQECTIYGGCFDTPENIIEHLPERQLCWTGIDCPRGDDGIFDDRSTGGIGTVQGGGSSGLSINTGSEAFNDRITACNEGGGPGDPPVDGGEASPDEAFCLAIRSIMTQCDRFGLGSPQQRHILEILDGMNDCDNGGVLDDQGVLTEAADYICNSSDPAMAVKTIKEYAEYAAIVGFEEALCFDEFLLIDGVVEELGIGISPIEFLLKYNLEDCINSLNCKGGPCIGLTECAIEKMAYFYSDTEDVEASESGFFDRTLNCESFNFVAQSSAAGQIACVDGLYLSKNFGGLFSVTESFCGHITVPRVRFDGQVISSGKAADCAAWASNAAAAVVGLAFIESDYQMADEAMIRLFRVTFGIKMSLSGCGYGIMGSCEFADCLSPPSSASWNQGFFEWLDEQFFGCE